ncbi:phosphoglycerate mutase-like protein [Lentithecium fluviatile CBS 122367]|uniref:Phosphoglycerate mutase-like protein n=1 Tax=Lentithecium fluviatile CBS 122367 TaxID=1168545 RepID=A0A6G1IYI7_9PLEO|nr:phosphoglycerate mutase-like protein [Lentithecium fluviatile CBS 122367]
MNTSQKASIYLIRHGESLHNVDRTYPHRDPPLTDVGHHSTKNIKMPVSPHLILISPMTRTLQTAMNIFPFLREPAPHPIPVQIWPELREAHDAICNIGLSRADMQARYPHFDFSECNEEWDYSLHTSEGATARAERVRARLKALAESYNNIAVITHRGLVAFLAKGRRFNVCEVREYRFASDEEISDEQVRWGVNCDTLVEQDFGPTVLEFVENHTTSQGEDAHDLLVQ